MHFGTILGLQSGLGRAEMCGSVVWRRPGLRPLFLSPVDEQVAHRIQDRQDGILVDDGRRGQSGEDREVGGSTSSEELL